MPVEQSASSPLQYDGVLPDAETDVKEKVQRWKRDAEIEFFPSVDLVPLHGEIATLGHRISISSPATMPWDESFACARDIRTQTGIEITLHSSSRKKTDDQDVAEKIARMQEAGLGAFLIAGDDVHPAGQFSSTIQVLESMERQHIHLKRIGFPAYPHGSKPGNRGHGIVSNENLLSALFAKRDYAERTGTHAYFVTQLQFFIDDIAPWVKTLREKGFLAPMYVNIVTPVSFPLLVGYLRRCGLANMQRVLDSFPDKLTMITQFAKGYNPDTLLYDLARQNVDIQGIVVTSTNRLPQTVEWLKK